MPVSLRTGGDTRHAQPKSACTFLAATARASSEHSVRVQAVEVEHTECCLVAFFSDRPFRDGRPMTVFATMPLCLVENTTRLFRSLKKSIITLRPDETGDFVFVCPFPPGVLLRAHLYTWRLYGYGLSCRTHSRTP